MILISEILLSLLTMFLLILQRLVQRPSFQLGCSNDRGNRGRWACFLC